jgi:hypothetical protein
MDSADLEHSVGLSASNGIINKSHQGRTNIEPDLCSKLLTAGVTEHILSLQQVHLLHMGHALLITFQPTGHTRSTT